MLSPGFVPIPIRAPAPFGPTAAENRRAPKLLVDLIAARLKAIEVQDLEDRLTELEKSAETLEGAPRRNGRRR